MNTYEIYPLPQEIKYQHSLFQLDKPIEVVFDVTIDLVTKNKVEKLLTEYHIQYSIVEQQTNQKYLHIGTKQFEKEYIDTYELIVEEQRISILGKDTDAAFYGVITLERILQQIEGRVIQGLHIFDYANTKIRGVIEGYYGIPWSYQDRKSLLTFGSQWKANTFIFAPKDDPYHREKWDELYPTELVQEIGKLAKLGNETKNRFVWTISPLGHVAGLARSEGTDSAMALLAENIDKMLKKFDQLYDVGIRQFGVLGDDVGSLPLQYVVQLMNAVSRWADEKGDVYDTLYCPASYNSAWAWIPEELNAYEEGFAENIQIFWTGSTTCGPVVQDTINVFKHQENNGLTRRDPLFWLNWPVNDVDMSRVFLGKGEMLEKNINHLAGVVTNPMQEAEASKLAIFAICDYTWNTTQFHDQTSWQNSIKYIEPNATKELLAIAEHMSDAHPNGLQLSESEQMKDDLALWLEYLELNQVNEENSKGLLTSFQQIIISSERFLLYAENKKLTKELEPFILSLHDLAVANTHFIQAAIQINSKKASNAWTEFAKALSFFEQSNQYTRPMLVGTKYVRPAQKRLQPFTRKIKQVIASQLSLLLEVRPIENGCRIDSNRKDASKWFVAKQGAQFIIQGPSNCKFTFDEYIGLKFDQVKEITDIQIEMNNSFQIETSINGFEWKIYQDHSHCFARFIRIVHDSQDDFIYDMNRFTIKVIDIQPKSVLETNVESADQLLALFNHDLTEATTIKESQQAGKFVTYDLGQEILIENLKLYVNESEFDYPRHAIIEGSLDGTNWTRLMTIGNQDGPNPHEASDGDKIADIFNQFSVPYRFCQVTDLHSRIKYIRLRVTKDLIGTDRWLRVQGLVINDGIYYPSQYNPTVQTNVEILKNHEVDYAIDGNILTSFRQNGNHSGHVLYHAGEIGDDCKRLTILEDPNRPSNSQVSIRTVDGWKLLGFVDQGYKQFDVSMVKQLLDIKIAWEKNHSPIIYQIFIQ